MIFMAIGLMASGPAAFVGLRFDSSLQIHHVPANKILILGLSGILDLKFLGILSLIEPFVSPSLSALFWVVGLGDGAG